MSWARGRLRSLLLLVLTTAAMAAAAHLLAGGPAQKPRKEEGRLEPASTQGLQELWASAYEAWIWPPGTTAPAEVVYLAPVTETQMGGQPAAASSSEGECQELPPWVEATLAIADRNDGLYGITAFNPKGEERPHAQNIQHTSQLEEEVRALCPDGSWWRSFGFAENWHEKGFTIAAPREKVLALARKYGQGAIYRFSRAPSAVGECRHPAGAPPFVRSTIPALVADTEADVLMNPCAKPRLAQASALWTPPVAT